jgi:hypothetical protein
VDDLRIVVYPEDTTDAANGAAVEAPLSLSPAGANPFRTATHFELTVGRATPLRAAVYAVDGRLVRWIATGMVARGEHILEWDGRDNQGRQAPSGTYFLRIDTDAGSVSRRVVRLR